MIPQHVTLKGFKQGRKMTLKEYQLRVIELSKEVKERVGDGMTREQTKRFQRDTRLEVPFVPKLTFAMVFEVKMVKMKEKYVQMFMDELAGRVAMPPLPVPFAVASPQQQKPVQSRTAVLDATALLTAREKQLAIMVARCHEEMFIDTLREYAQNNSEVHEAKEAYADAVLAFISKEGVTPSSREDAMWMLRLYGSE